MQADVVMGWDIGGAHLKVAAVDAGGRVVRAAQRPCALWLGLEQLDAEIGSALSRLPAARLHAVTMTGELADVFRDRAHGVKSIIARFATKVPSTRIWLYAGPEGFLTPRHAARKPDAVASANWAASAQWVARCISDALFVDIGSTTTDLVPIRDGVLRVDGFSDAQRLVAQELVYTGVVRTPVMALANRIPFDGQWIPAMAEHFATMADVYRLTGELSPGADQLPAADHGAKTLQGSARRLARMVGRESASAPLARWQRCARELAELQLQQIRKACEHVLSRTQGVGRGPLVGAGTGRFVARKLAARLGLRYRDFDTLIDAGPGAGSWAASCAPAVAVALLAQSGIRT